MLMHLRNILQLGIKELFSLRRDVVMVVLIFYGFSFNIYVPAQHAHMELRNAAVAVVDEDHSQLSRAIQDALLLPYFKQPVIIQATEIDRVMDTGLYTFVIDIPPNFQRDILSGHRPTIQVNVDATAMTQAGHGAGYLQQIITRETQAIMGQGGAEDQTAVSLNVRVKFNPNLYSKWFLGVMQLINMITILAIVLTGAALIREREHGTIEHLLVMPLTPAEIMIAKVWANGLVIVLAAFLSLQFVIKGLLGVEIAGSIPLFILGTMAYLFSVSSLGIFLATLVRSMPQFGLLAFPVFIMMILLSGGTTPLQSMPVWLQNVMQVMPSTHFVSLAQAILYRGAGFEVVWLQFLTILGIGAVFFLAALKLFRRSLEASQ